jgi:uncharacterized membrane-anchored protein YhcB (DUF1043 family)
VSKSSLPSWAIGVIVGVVVIGVIAGIVGIVKAIKARKAKAEQTLQVEMQESSGSYNPDTQ